MKELSVSPDRGHFSKNMYIKRCEESGYSLDTPEVAATIKLFDLEIENFRIRDAELMNSEDNLEYDLRTTDWILEKVRANNEYAVNLYSALCNNTFQKLAVMPILKNDIWSCSWRYAGGIIAHMREAGDYLDWYCSGNEGHVTEEVRSDLVKLGWRVQDE